MSKINKPTISDYVKIQEFADACAQLTRTLSMLNNHIEILKRSGDVESLRNLDTELNEFLFKIVSQYKQTLHDEKES